VPLPVAVSVQAADDLIVRLAGYGPTDTHYADPSNDPRSGKKH